MLRFAVLLAATVCLSSGAAAQSDSTANTFLRWAAGALRPVSVDSAGEKLIDADRLLEMIGSASITALSEATHNGDEVLRFRNALFLALARERRYGALAIESGLSEGARLYEYVRGGSRSFGATVDSGFSWTFHTHRANQGLLQILRAYNTAAPGSPVSLYGFDVPGSPGNTAAVRGVSTALGEALSYLREVDEAESERINHRVATFLGATPRETYAHYLQLAFVDRDRLSGAIADLIGVFERREKKYTEATSAERFAWGYRHAIGARQIDTWLRMLPLNERPKHYFEHHAYRDRAMVENVDWIKRREGPDARLMVFASRFHIAGSPVQVLSLRDSEPTQAVTLGSYLRVQYGNQVVLIGNIFGRSPACPPSKPSTSMSLDRLLSTLGVRSFVLDLRQAPQAVRAWLDQTHALDEYFAVNMAQAFDIIYYNQVDPPRCRP